MMEAIILAGGLGTRLRTVISELPKPMAPIDNKPFLEYLLNYVIKQGVTRIILSTGYKHEYIKDYFGDRFKNTSICYAVEEVPLGTGGGIKKALEKVRGDNVFILNGDTFFNVNFEELYNSHIAAGADLTLSLKPMEKFDRYGAVLTERGRIIGFVEKKYNEKGYINGGVYVARKSLFEGLNLPDKFSFETDYMEKHVQNLHFNAYFSDTYFIDIGIPEDYNLAQSELRQFI